MRETLHTFGWMISSMAMNSWNCSGEIIDDEDFWLLRFLLLTGRPLNYLKMRQFLVWFSPHHCPDVFLLSINYVQINLAYLNKILVVVEITIWKSWHPMFTRFLLGFDIEKCNLPTVSTLSFAGLPRLFSVRWCFFYVNGTFHRGITKPFILNFTGVLYWNSQHSSDPR